MKRTPRPSTRAIAVNTQYMWQIKVHTHTSPPAWRGEVAALWTRKRDGNLTVYLGTVTGYQPHEADSVTQWMERYIQPMQRRLTSTYNGTKFWHRGAGLDKEEHLLEQVYNGELPAPFEGWWTPQSIAPRNGFGHHPRADHPIVALCGVEPLMSSASDTAGTLTICPMCEAARADLATN